MPSQGDQDFLEAAQRLGFLPDQTLPEILSDQKEVSRFLGRSLPIAHLVHQRQWLTPDQILTVREEIRRQPMLCPHCWGRTNVYGFAPGKSFACTGCTRHLRVPGDPFAEVLLRVGTEKPGTAPVAGPAAPPGARSQQFARHREAFALRGFELVAEAGCGRLGVVYQARQLPHGRPMAIRVLHEDLGGDPRALRRFFREARMISHIRHPNVVALHHSGFADGAYFLVLDWVAGKNLRDLSAETGPMPAPRALRLARDLARGLGAIHAAGLITRDVKPSNAIVREDGSACLIDFGLVRPRESGAAGDSHDSGLTQAGEVLGTINYMPPEQLQDPRKVTPASDVYGLGATLYHLLAGEAPLAGGTLLATALRLSSGEVPRLDTARLGLPDEVAQLVARLMAPDPARRPQTMEEVDADIVACR